MNKSFKFGLIFVALILIAKGIGSGLKNSKKMIFEVILKKYGQIRANKFKAVYNALETLNLSKNQLLLTLSQIMQETGVFGSTSNVFSLNNNASGISFSGSAGQLSTGAIKGSPRPLKEGANTFYAKYPNLNSWAKDYMRILNKGTMPLNATSTEDFVHRLKLNKYFTDSEANYLKNVKSYYNLINI